MTTNKAQVVGYSPHNVLGQAPESLYLNDPMGKIPTTEPEPPKTPESEGPTSEPDDKTDWKKRYSDAKSHFDKTTNSLNSTISELKTQFDELKEKQASATAPVMPKTADEYKVFKEKYPELAANIETAAIMAVNSQTTIVNEKLKQLATIQDSIRAREGINELQKLHPDFLEIKDDPRFHAWFNEQLPEIQNLLKSPNPKTIAKGLDLYKKDVGIKTPAEKKEDAKNLLREPKSQQRIQLEEGQKRTWTETEIRKMSLVEFEKHKDDILLAQREGRIVKS